MADTLPNITVPEGEWIDLYALSGVTVGEAVVVDNIGAADVYVAKQAAQPTPDHDAYNIVRRWPSVPFPVCAGESGLWAFCPNQEGKVNVRQCCADGAAARFLGIFATPGDLETQFPAADQAIGSTAAVLSTETFWYVNSSPVWVDTGLGAPGDMLKSVYDPTNVEADAFSMGNMAETPTAKILTDVERNEIAANTAARHDAVTLNADGTTQDTLNLAGQEIQVNLATPGTAGAMSAADKTKSDFITATGPADLDTIQSTLATAEQTANKGQPNGYASLDGSGLVPGAQLPSSVIGGIKVIGSWNADTNVPDLSALTLDQGEAYIVSVGGSTNLNGETNWRAKDLAVWDDTLAGNWFKLDNTDDVLSVNGQTGTVVLNADNIDETASRVWFLPAERVDLTTLRDGSNADALHRHAFITDGANNSAAISAGTFLATLGGVVRWAIDAAGNLLASAYPQNTRNDGTVADQKSLYTDNSGNVLLGKVLPYLQMISDTAGAINNTTTFATYLQLDFTVTENGDYPVEWFYVWSYNTATTDFLANVILDTNPPSAPVTLCEHVQEPKDSGGGGADLPNLNPPPATINSGTNQRHPCSGFALQSLTAGDYSVYIEIACGGAGNEAACYRGGIKVGHRANV